MPYRVRTETLAVLDIDRERAAAVVADALNITFGGPKWTVRAFMEATLVVGPTQDAPPGSGSTAHERAAWMDWARGVTAAKAALRAQVPALLLRLSANERDAALGRERIVLDVLDQHGRVIPHPLEGWSPPQVPAPRVRRR